MTEGNNNIITPRGGDNSQASNGDCNGSIASTPATEPFANNPPSAAMTDNNHDHEQSSNDYPCPIIGSSSSNNPSSSIIGESAADEFIIPSPSIIAPLDDTTNSFNNSASSCNFNNSASSCNFNNSAATLRTSNYNIDRSRRENHATAITAIPNESATETTETTAATATTETAVALESETTTSEMITAVTTADRDIKERRTTNPNDEDAQNQVGAVHIDERAPQINRRFFQGLTRPGQRLRAREERARTRRLTDESSHQQQEASVPSVPMAAVEENGSGTNFNPRGLFARANSRLHVMSGLNNNSDHDNLGLVSATLVEEQDIFVAEVIEDGLPIPDSDVERIVQRLELRNANRVPVPLDVKNRFLRLCNDACRRRIMREGEDKGLGTTRNLDDDNSSDDGSSSDEGGLDVSPVSKNSAVIVTQCILREDVINLRNAIRLELENRSRMTLITDGVKKYFGFRCHCRVLLNVLNRAVDLIDESGPNRGRKRPSNGRNGNVGAALGCSVTNGSSFVSTLSGLTIAASLDQNLEEGINNDAEDEWFYYKDFSFYNLTIESNYPWMRGAGVFSILVTFAFLIFTPILWCGVLQDENICPSDGSPYNGWLTSLYFASATMSTVGYGDTTVFTGSSKDGNSIPEMWRIFIAIIFMIFSLIVSVVGFKAGLDSQFNPFRRRIDDFGRRVYEILRDSNVVKGAHDKHEDIVSRMRWAKFSRIFEICLIFLILNLTGMFALQLSLLSSNTSSEGEVGGKLSISWMKSLYWAVQTTTTIGYGDVETPDDLRWFLLIYLSLSTYFVGSSFGKLSELSAKLESMQQLYLWQQQEASYTMLTDFSGRPYHRDGGGSGDDEEAQEIFDRDPEINQFEFTIASLVLLGKITSADVRPILEKFKKLTGDNNVITVADVPGPMKENEEPVEDEEEAESEEESTNTDGNFDIQNRASSSGALAVGKKIAKAFREELLNSVAVNEVKEISPEEDLAIEYSKFRLPTNTYAIAIDDSKIQRKLLGKLLGFAGIPTDRTTIVGDGYEEILGFEDFVINFMTHHSDDYVFLLVDENLDTLDDHSNHMTISGSLCVENIRKRLPSQLERRICALVRSANDSSSDIAIYESRAHGFFPKKPIKRDKVCETLAPMWLHRFPKSEFGETICLSSKSESHPIGNEDVACTPYDIAQKVTHIESLFESNVYVTDVHTIHEQIHELKGDILTLNSTVSVTNIIGHINLLLVAQAPEIVFDRWQRVRDDVNNVINSLQKNFRVPTNTYAIAIDDSKIQRKLLSKFFQFMDIPESNTTILGDGTAEILGFEKFVLDFMRHHTNDYVFIIVDENLDIVDENAKHITISGSLCVENIREQLPYELEKRLLAVVRSANDSTTDVAVFNTRAHGVLPKAPIRREKVNETLAPLWFARFPLSGFSDSVGFDKTDESDSSLASDELTCAPSDIAQTLVEIDSLFERNEHSTNWRVIHDRLHMLKGDILTLTSDASMISILGMINLMLFSHSQDPGGGSSAKEKEKWQRLRYRIYDKIHEMQRKPQVGEKSAQKYIATKLGLSRRASVGTPKSLSGSSIPMKAMSSSFTSAAVSEVSLSGSFVPLTATEADESILGDN